MSRTLRTFPKKRSFAIGIPTLNRYDLLEPSLRKYEHIYSKTDIHIVDNGNQNIQPGSNTTVHVMPENIGVAASWNMLCKEIFKKHTHALILNDDVFYSKSFTTVSHFLRDWFQQSEKGWCVFMLPRDVYKKVGDFDEKFYPAYFEDNDYSYRISLAYKKSIKFVPIIQNSVWNPEVFRRSMSLEKDKSVNDRFMKNQEYYISKWGGMPGQEKYTIPFNKAV